MTAPRLVLLAVLLVAACRQPADTPEPADDPRLGAARAPSRTTPPKDKTSIMRPSVLEETPTAPAAPPAVVEPPPSRLAVTFATGSAELTAAARTAIERFAATALSPNDHAVVVRGHTDSRGSDRRNLELSAERARTVVDHLASLGVARGRVTLVALGETRPVAPNANLDGSDFPEGRARNRRAVIEVQPSAREPAEAAGADLTANRDRAHR